MSRNRTNNKTKSVQSLLSNLKVPYSHGLLLRHKLISPDANAMQVMSVTQQLIRFPAIAKRRAAGETLEDILRKEEMKRSYRQREIRPKRLGPMLESRTVPTLPCYHRALVTAGLIEPSTSMPLAFELFTVVSGQPEMKAAREKVLRQKTALRIMATAPFAVSVAALRLLSTDELQAVRERLANGEFDSATIGQKGESRK
jgi:hypothetical protein